MKKRENYRFIFVLKLTRCLVRHGPEFTFILSRCFGQVCLLVGGYSKYGIIFGKYQMKSFRIYVEYFVVLF